MSPELLSYTDLADTVPAVVYTAAADDFGTCLYINRYIETLLGYTPEEWLADRGLWHTVVHADDRERAIRAFHGLSLGDPPVVQEYRMYRRDGALIWVRDFSQVIKSPFAKEPIFQGIAVEITAEKRALEELRSNEARYRIGFKASPGPMWVYDLETLRFLAVNDAAVAHYGYSHDEFLAMTIKDIRPPEDVPRLIEKVAAQVSGIDDAGLWRHRTKDGRIIDVRIASHSVIYGDRAAEVVKAHDVTEQLRADAQVKAYIARIERTILGTANAIAGLSDLRDPYTGGHELRVGEIAASIAAEMGLSEDMRQGLKIAGSLHDVGKMAIPTEILSKPGRLSTLEFDLIKSHAQAGYEVLKNIDFPWPVAEVARQHHERLDGSGYPRGLKGDRIIPEARIIAVADVLEAMSAHRPFRSALGMARALEEIAAGRGTRYDATVVDAALRCIHEDQPPRAA